MMDVEEHISFVKWFLQRRNGIPSSDYEDVEQECLLRIYQKLNKYDETRGKESTFLFLVCSEVVCKWMNKYVKYKNTYISNDEKIYNATTSDYVSLIDAKLDGYTELLENKRFDI